MVRREPRLHAAQIGPFLKRRGGLAKLVSSGRSSASKTTTNSPRANGSA
jgi:hypothetical protein